LQEHVTFISFIKSYGYIKHKMCWNDTTCYTHSSDFHNICVSENISDFTGKYNNTLPLSMTLKHLYNDLERSDLMHKTVLIK